MTEIANIVSTVGFPIASFLISAWFIKYSYDKQIEKDKLSDERSEKHWLEIARLTEAVNNNTETLREIVARDISEKGVIKNEL